MADDQRLRVDYLQAYPHVDTDNNRRFNLPRNRSFPSNSMAGLIMGKHVPGSRIQISRHRRAGSVETLHVETLHATSLPP